MTLRLLIIIPLSLSLLGCQPAVTPPIANWQTEAFALCQQSATDAPRYKLEQFHRHDLVHLHETTLQLINWTQDQQKTADHPVTVHELAFEVTYYGTKAVAVPLTQWVFIRRVVTNAGDVIDGRWSGQNQTHTEFIPLAYQESRVYTVQLFTPVGTVSEVGVMTQLHTGIPGGTPIWFSPDSDPHGCPTISEDPRTVARPTPHIYGYGGRGRKPLPAGATCTQPAAGTLVRGYGCSLTQGGLSDQRHCGGDAPYFHNGWDIDGLTGDTVWAPLSGTAETGHDPLRGHFIRISGEKERAKEQHELLHLSAVFVATGEEVEVGEVIGEMGDTGNSHGAHLHWAIWQNGEELDPQKWGCDT